VCVGDAYFTIRYCATYTAALCNQPSASTQHFIDRAVRLPRFHVLSAVKSRITLSDYRRTAARKRVSEAIQRLSGGMSSRPIFSR
jgi:hypothetical protein